MFDSVNPFNTYVFDQVRNTLLSAVPWLIIVIIIGIASAAVSYIFPCTVIRNMARKAKLKRDWMAFVPVASDIYRLDIVSMPRWKVLFFGGTGIAFNALVLFLISLISAQSNGPGWIVVGALLFAAWLTMFVFTSYKYYYELFKNFGYDPGLALLAFVPGAGAVVCFTLEIMFAYNKSIRFNDSTGGIGSGGGSGGGTGGEDDHPPFGTIKGISGVYAGASFTVKKGETITFGREPLSCHVIYDQFKTAVSKKHCEVSFDGKFYYVTDHSSNGTFLENGNRLPLKQTEMLPRGSVIYLADKAEAFRLS